MSAKPPEIFIDLDKDGLTGGYQLSIGDGHDGYRLAGPKYNGYGKRLQRMKNGGQAVINPDRVNYCWEIDGTLTGVVDPA